MSEVYERSIGALRHEIESGGARLTVIDAALGELLAKSDQRLPSDLLSLLSDSAGFDEGMFSLIHAAESWDDGTYVRALLSVLPGLASSSPRWASIVFMRALNSASTQAEMVTQLPDMPPSVKDAVREMCGRVDEASPAFLNKTALVAVAAS